MGVLEQITSAFAQRCREILGGNLTGVYLHGSAAMGCFNEKKSDIDLLVVAEKTVSEAIKRRFMDMVVGLNKKAPEKGIEMSILKREVCNPFVYPTPFELHFSIAHLNWYQRDPADYIAKMQGTDKDLAAHVTIVRHRGKCLYGEPIERVFGEVPAEDYFDSIRGDIEEAEVDILQNPVYVILNLCRVLAYRREGRILSKAEGGAWGLESVPEEYRDLVRQALAEYANNTPLRLDERKAIGFAAYMLGRIKSAAK